jgi:hypothetical protein
MNQTPLLNKPENPESPIAKLLQYQSEGYLFHGSSNGAIEQLEPREAKDVDPNKTFNNDTAVFASKLALAAVIFGSVPAKSELPEELRTLYWATSWKDGNVTSRIPKSWKEYIENFNGFVYVLPSETFTESNGTQYKSKEIVKPIDTIQVNIKDFLQMGGQVQWIEDPNELKI